MAQQSHDCCKRVTLYDKQCACVRVVRFRVLPGCGYPAFPLTENCVDPSAYAERGKRDFDSVLSPDRHSFLFRIRNEGHIPTRHTSDTLSSPAAESIISVGLFRDAASHIVPDSESGPGRSRRKRLQVGDGVLLLTRSGGHRV